MIESKLDNIGIEYIADYPMSRFTWLKVGGSANFVIYPKTAEQLAAVIILLNKEAYPWVVLGEGSNTIILDKGKGIEKAVIITKKMKSISITDSGEVVAEAGANMGTIMNQTIRKALTGFEFAAGIPGTLGGGVFMNAGANDAEIKDVIKKVWLLIDGKEEIVNRNELNFEYRKSNLPEQAVVMKAEIKLEKGDRQQSEKQVKEYLEKRSRTQPIKMSNTGSIFKNPQNIAAGRLIEELGLKGYEIGGAQISELHGNFIVNTGSAKASEVLELIDLAKENALKTRGIKLEPEVRIIG
ncbi:MAG: UDP-N-acetylmuramate dehydrogenase [Candidatus Dadabacteria bacterium]|nr:UDP-N-acetylmuramate dehydrogenase [Candidatus Dadabacteria bacterium]NIV41684.1 UDP-N-acetylmuramate dehydrogenase [Candidatus Dadabacteria bacterium]NIX16303.1 UDP-N-acetylmuramate dehydrogenase [Candidatus Dadabacteria bacterium]